MIPRNVEGHSTGRIRETRAAGAALLMQAPSGKAPICDEMHFTTLTRISP